LPVPGAGGGLKLLPGCGFGCAAEGLAVLEQLLPARPKREAAVGPSATTRRERRERGSRSPGSAGEEEAPASPAPPHTLLLRRSRRRCGSRSSVVNSSCGPRLPLPLIEAATTARPHADKLPRPHADKLPRPPLPAPPALPRQPCSNEKTTRTSKGSSAPSPSDCSSLLCLPLLLCLPRSSASPAPTAVTSTEPRLRLASSLRGCL
jgi:hypothetical protein